MKKNLLLFFLFFSFGLLSAQQYCPAHGANGTGGDFISNITVGKINNNSDKSAYTDFTSIKTDLVQGSTNTLKLTANAVFDLDRAYAWIDYNNDKKFDSLERINMPLFSGNSSEGSFVVPSNQLGDRRLRVRITYISRGGQWNPCDSLFGEVEDYTVTLKASSCPTVGQACNDNNDCTTNDKIDGNCNCIGTLIDKDKDRICDKDDVCDGKDDNIDDNKNGIPDCTEGKYCISYGAAGTGGDFINRVRINTLVNSSLQTAYSDYSNRSTNLVQGGTYDLFIHLNFKFDLDSAYAYLDFNQDSIFQSNELITMSPFDDKYISKGKVTVPANAKLGKARLRTRAVYADRLTYNACGAIFGEVEDYTAVIVAKTCSNVGKPCDDGKVCTTKDTFNINCDCVGIFVDADDDNVCDALDKCADSDDQADINQNGVLDCGDVCVAIGQPSNRKNFISEFNVNDYKNSSKKSGYSFFKNKEIKVVIGDTQYDVIAKIGEYGTDVKVGAWIDFNDDKLFDENESLQMSPLNADDSTSIGSFLVPIGAKPGKKLLRILTDISTTDDAIPCGVSEGEVEEYVVNLIPLTNTENISAESFSMYPNPAINTLTIQENTSLSFNLLEVFDISGKFIVSQKLDPADTQHSVDISRVNSGIYIAKVSNTQGQIAYQKFVKQ
jgi:hypothetical protein